METSVKQHETAFKAYKSLSTKIVFMSMKPKRPMLLDLIGWNLIILAFICFTYVATVQKTAGMETIVPIVFVLGGVFFGLGTHCIINDWRITRREMQDSLLWFIIVFGAIMTVQVGVIAASSHIPFNIKFDVMDLKVYGVLIGVAEEILFRGVMLVWFSAITPLGSWLGIPISAGAWTIFHFAVYGTQPIALLLVLMVGIVLGFIASFGPSSTNPNDPHRSNATRRLWVFMGAHALVNLIAMGGFTLFSVIIIAVFVSALALIFTTSRRRR